MCIPNTQKDFNLTLEGAQLIIAHFQQGSRVMSLQGEYGLLISLKSTAFEQMLNSRFNYVFDPRHAKIYQDMSRPITDYFISSSHNTYLEGDQLRGRSSSEQ